MDDELSAKLARRKKISEAKIAPEAGAAPANDEAGVYVNWASPASQRIAAGGAASGGQKPPSTRAAPANNAAGARANWARPSSQAGFDAELKLKLEKRQQMFQAQEAAGGTSGGAEPGPAAAGASKGPAPVPHAVGARAHEVPGIGASAGGSTGAGAKMPKEIVPLLPSSEEGSDATRRVDGDLVGSMDGASTCGTRALAGEEEEGRSSISSATIDASIVAKDGEEEGFVKVERDEAAVLVSCLRPRHPRLLTNTTSSSSASHDLVSSI